MMTLTLDLNAAQKNELQDSASRLGMSIDEYALQKLFSSLSLLTDEKPFRALQFAGIAPSGRTAEEIDAEIRVLRDEWDDSEQNRRVAVVSPVEN